VLSYTPLEASNGIEIKGSYIWLGVLGLSMVQIKLDCKLVVKGIVDSSNNQSNFDNILSNCRSLLEQFLNFKISFFFMIGSVFFR